MTINLVGELPTLNQYINAERTNRFMAAKMKKDAEKDLLWQLKAYKFRLEGKYRFHFTWYRKNSRTDPDNICAARKFVMDSLVKSGVLLDDKWKHVKGFSDEFEVSNDTGIKIEIVEV